LNKKIKEHSLIRSFKHSLPTQLLQAREAAMSRFRPMLRRHGLTEQRWRVIRTIHEHSQIDASELASRSFLLSPSLTRILKYLEIENIVLRSGDTSDLRRSVFCLTDKGKNIITDVAPETESLYEEIESLLGAEKIQQILTLLAEFSIKINKE
jgi:homoprotocatechuate degradation regulator HpaR|tara:strand:- start:905 stop:1363 length:459 start_codon:yes stop_codon:yes gene_type:complete